MDAPPETTAVWIAESPPTDNAKIALERWARGRGVRITSPQAAREIAVDRSVSSLIESELAKAKDAILAGDAERAESRLANASTLVRLHPELPEAAWLRAEVDRAWGMRFVRLEPKDPTRARQWLAEAEGLDGGRAAGIGEPSAPPRETILASFEWLADPRVDVRLDGRLISPGEAHVTGGEHHLFVTRSGKLAWSGWVAIVEGISIQVPNPPAPPCSDEDLDHAGRATARCPTWLAIHETRESLSVAECHGRVCGPPTSLSIRGTARSSGDTHAWPAWATWSMLGIAAAAATTVGLVAGGAFEPASRETRFVNGGTRTSTFPGVRFQ